MSTSAREPPKRIPSIHYEVSPQSFRAEKRDLPVTYVSSALHPLSGFLWVHYFALSVEQSAASGAAAVVLLGVIDYWAAVEELRERLARQLHRTSRRGGDPFLSPLSATEAAVSAIRAGAVHTLRFEGAAEADVVVKCIKRVAESGGHVLGTYDLASCGASSVSWSAFYGIARPGSQVPISAVHPPAAESSSGAHEMIRGDREDETSNGKPASQERHQRLRVGDLAPGVGGAAEALREAVIWATQEYYLPRDSSVMVCRIWHHPGPLVRNSPRTYALWIRTQLLRDAGYHTHTLKDERGPTTAEASDMAVGRTSDTASPSTTVSSKRKRQLQKQQLLHDLSLCESLTETLFNDRVPLTASAEYCLKHGLGDVVVATGTRSGGDSLVGLGRSDGQRRRRSGSITTTSSAGPRSGGGNVSSLSVERMLAQQARAPAAMILDMLKLWLNIVRVDDSDLTTMAHMAQHHLSLEDESFDRILRFLQCAEALRRRRALLRESAIVTASAAARNDFQQSNVVRVLETWFKERREKVLGSVGNIVGARMAVEPNWPTENHPRFGREMRLAHFSFQGVQRTVLDCCSSSLQSMTPDPVTRCRNEWRRVVQKDPVLFRFKTLLVQLAAAVAKLSKRLVCSPGDLSLLHSKEEALCTVLRSLPFLPGDSVLVVDPPLDSVLSVLGSYLEKRCGVRVAVLRLGYELSDEASLHEFEAALREVDPVLCLLHVISPAGRVVPVANFVSVCSQKGVLSMVDATEGVGNVSLSAVEIDSDVLMACLDRYLCCPMGVTALVVKPKMQKLLTTLTVSYFFRPSRRTSAGGAGNSGGGGGGEQPIVDARDRASTVSNAAGGGAAVPPSFSPWGAVTKMPQLPEESSQGVLVGASGGISALSAAATGASGPAKSQGGISLGGGGGSTYAAEWWYTGLNDYSSFLVVKQALQFKKFICFGSREYCGQLARQAEAYLCRVWRVEPLLPPATRHPENAIVCVQLPRTEGLVASDATHVQQQLRSLSVIAHVVPLAAPSPPAAAATVAASQSASSRSATGDATGGTKGRGILAVRLSLNVYNDMHDVKVLAACVIRLVSSTSWQI